MSIVSVRDELFSWTKASLDDMGTRIDDLEKNIAELMMQAGVDEAQDSKQDK